MLVDERERESIYIYMNGRKPIQQKTNQTTKSATAKNEFTTASNKRRPLPPVRQRRGGRYADTTSRASNGDGGMALLNAVRSQGRLEALHDQSRKTITNLEMRLGKTEATLRHKLDGHRAERDGDIGMGTIPPTVPLHTTDNDDGASQQAPTPDVETPGATPMPTPSPMGAMPTPKPGAKQQPAQRVARPKASMEVDSVSPISKRPSTTALAQPSSSRARVSDSNNQLVLSASAKPKLDRERDDDEVLGNKKPRSQGFGTTQVSAITESGKKMRAQPGEVAAGPLALPASTTGRRQLVMLQKITYFPKKELFRTKNADTRHKNTVGTEGQAPSLSDARDERVGHGHGGSWGGG